MKKKIVISFIFLFCCFISSTTTCFSSPLPFPDDIFSSYSSFGRALLEDKLERCPLDFNVMDNYTIITSKCKQPYDNQSCCESFLDFACPYWSELNDLKTECRIQMFNKLRQYGYPPGLFKGACEGCPIGGIECPALPPGEAEQQSVKNDSYNIRSPSLLLTLAVGFIIF